jgi:hypothetical protein
METQTGYYFAAVLVLAAVLAAWWAWRRWADNQGKSRFTYATPATPRIREAVSGLLAVLGQVATLGRAFEGQAARLGDATPVAGQRLAAAQVTTALENAGRALVRTPPTYASYLAVYRALAGTDTELLATADAYTNAGHELHQRIARALEAERALLPAPPGTGTLWHGTPPTLPETVEMAALGGLLLEMGRRVRCVTAAVHRLGVALDVE